MNASRRNPEQITRLRERIAREAARLLARGKVNNVHTARMRAMRWLSQGRLSNAEVPSQEEILRELHALQNTSDWDQLSRINWATMEVANWLAPCEPWLEYNWREAAHTQGVVICWMIAREQLAVCEQQLRVQNLLVTTQLIEQQIVQLQFSHTVPQQILAVPARRIEQARELTLTAAPAAPLEILIAGLSHHFLPATDVINELNQLSPTAPAGSFTDEPLESDTLSADSSGQPSDLSDDQQSRAATSVWTSQFGRLLEALGQLEWNSPEHPEGNVLFHTLQVFELGRDKHPWDEEFLWACLLHDLGQAIDPRQPAEALHRLLRGQVSERIEFLITELPAAHEILQGQPIRKSLRKHESFEELLDLARCDRDGRVSGADVPTLPQALDYLAEIASEWDEQ